MSFNYSIPGETLGLLSLAPNKPSVAGFETFSSGLEEIVKPPNISSKAFSFEGSASAYCSGIGSPNMSTGPGFLLSPKGSFSSALTSSPNGSNDCLTSTVPDR